MHTTPSPDAKAELAGEPNRLATVGGLAGVKGASIRVRGSKLLICSADADIGTRQAILVAVDAY